MDLFAKLKQLFSGGGSRSAHKMKRVDINQRFDLMGRTGQGSMSKVWRARDRETGKIVCLKVLDKVKTARFEARFIGLKRPPEGVILVTLRHQNIVQTYEYGMTREGEHFLVMELIDGPGLNFLIETHSPQLEGNRTNLLVQLGTALDFVHKKGYLHRDICPRNVMVTRDHVIKVIDFGLAIPYTPEFCRPGNRTGTPDYLAPEVIKRLQTDHRVDLFALGVTAYELFLGTKPWEKADSMETLLQHMRVPGRDPKDVNPELDDETAEFLRKAIERDPNKRFQSAAEFRDAVKRLPIA